MNSFSGLSQSTESLSLNLIFLWLSFHHSCAKPQLRFPCSCLGLPLIETETRCLKTIATTSTRKRGSESLWPGYLGLGFIRCRTIR